MKMLLISHQGAASGMKTAASLIAGDMADGIDTIELTAEAGIESFTEELDTYLKAWKETGKTGVIFADLKGGTPYNKAEILLAHYGMKGYIRNESDHGSGMLVSGNLTVESGNTSGDSCSRERGNRLYRTFGSIYGIRR